VSASPIRILIADDHEIVREGLRNLFSGEPGLKIVAEARDGEEALRAAARCRPDVALMDLVMPVVDGIEATRRMREISPRTRILVLTSFAGDRQVQDALKAGAIGYVLKDVLRQDLLDAIRSVHEGRPWLHPEAQRRLIASVSPDPAAQALEQLTARERDVLIRIAQGRSNRVIAAELFLSEGTVKGYVSVIFGKLGVKDRTQAALWAVKQGLITPQEI
jgi:DNA-binding NarL/FixJ family response regulator